MGGGSDYPAFYKENGGAVLSTTINKYCYVICRYLPPFFDYNYRIRYRKQEEVKLISEIEHPTVRECLKMIGLGQGVEIQHNADLPAMSGLGSSSAFTVGLLNALNALQGKLITKRQLALDAIHVEQDMVKENVGSQDQTIAAFGGLNEIRFGGRQKIVVQPVTISQERLELLQSHLMLFFTGYPRNASDIASEQIERTRDNISELRIMMGMVDTAIAILHGGEGYINDFGKLLHESWKIKRGLTQRITNASIDEIYNAGIESGATGGKLLGAGGGGFMLFFVNPELQPKVEERLGNLLHVPFQFHNMGSQIIYYAPEE
jgi:D-glycero-alpha-D-manno-heptose-7-phosphate kinase